MADEQSETTDEVSFLDLLVVLAESWVLLVSGAAMAAVLGYFIAIGQPTSYRSTVTIDAPPLLAQNLLATTATTSASALLNNKIAPDDWASRISLVPISDVATQVSITSATPTSLSEQLQALVSVYVKAAHQEKRQKAIRDIELAKARNVELTDTSTQLRRAADRVEAQTPFDGAAFSELAAVQRKVSFEQLMLSKRLDDMSTKLSYLPENAPVPAVSAPRREGPPHPGIVAAIAGLGMGFLLFILVLLRNALLAASQSPSGARKMERIRRGFFMNRRREKIVPQKNTR
jgi:hypothetical protein